MVASGNRKTTLSGLLNILKKKDPTAKHVSIWTDFYLFSFFLEDDSRYSPTEIIDNCSKIFKTKTSTDQ